MKIKAVLLVLVVYLTPWASSHAASGNTETIRIRFDSADHSGGADVSIFSDSDHVDPSTQTETAELSGPQTLNTQWGPLLVDGPITLQLPDRWLVRFNLKQEERFVFSYSRAISIRFAAGPIDLPNGWNGEHTVLANDWTGFAVMQGTLAEPQTFGLCSPKLPLTIDGKVTLDPYSGNLIRGRLAQATALPLGKNQTVTLNRGGTVEDDPDRINEFISGEAESPWQYDFGCGPGLFSAGPSTFFPCTGSDQVSPLTATLVSPVGNVAPGPLRFSLEGELDKGTFVKPEHFRVGGFHIVGSDIEDYEAATPLDRESAWATHLSQPEEQIFPGFGRLSFYRFVHSGDRSFSTIIPFQAGVSWYSPDEQSNGFWIDTPGGATAQALGYCKVVIQALPQDVLDQNYDINPSVLGYGDLEDPHAYDAASAAKNCASDPALIPEWGPNHHEN